MAMDPSGFAGIATPEAPILNNTSADLEALYKQYEADKKMGLWKDMEDEVAETPDYKNPEGETTGPAVANTTFKNTLPARSGKTPDVDPLTAKTGETDLMEGASFFGLGGVVNTISNAVPQVDTGGAMFLNPVLYDDPDAEEIEGEDWATLLGATDKPYVVMKDRKTGKRFKKEVSTARAFTELQRELDKKGKAESVSLRETGVLSSSVLNKAKSWVGNEFEPGQREQCSNFVRSVYREAGISVGASANPVDKAQTGTAQGPAYANSFFGEDVGQLIRDEDDLLPGDIVGFTNTYGNYASGTITHVGIYAGNGKVIDRPTANAPVMERNVSDFGGVSIGVRPYEAGKAGARLGAYSIAVDPRDEEAVATAKKHGFTPTDKSGIFSYMGAKNLPPIEEEDIPAPPIPYEDNNSWNEDMEIAYYMSEDTGINPHIFQNLVKQESGWRSDAISPVGAFGLTQLMPATAAEQAAAMGLDVTETDIRKSPELQLQIGMGYLKKMLDQFGNYPQALAAYNAGPGRMQAILQGGSEIPAETLNYVAKILNIPEGEAKSLILNFSKEKEAAAIAALGEPEAVWNPNVSPSAQSAEPPAYPGLEEEVGGAGGGAAGDAPGVTVPDLSGWFGATNKDRAAGIQGLEYHSDPYPLSPQMKNEALARKEEAKKEVVKAMVGKKNVDRSGDGWSTAKSFIASGFGMAVGLLDQIKTGGSLILGNDTGEELFDATGKVIDFLDWAVGISEETKSDIRFGSNRTSTIEKNFANTIALGTLSFLHENGEILSKEELKAAQSTKDAMLQQGGLIMSDAPVDEKSFHGWILGVQSDFTQNPLAPFAVAIQMQGAAALGAAKGLTAAAKGGSKLASRTQKFLNFMGGKQASGVAGALTNAALRAEVSMGILGGTEVFLSQLARYSSRDDLSAGQALMAAGKDGATAAVLGLGMGLAGIGGGMLAQSSVRGLSSASRSIAERPLVKGAMNNLAETKVGKTVTSGIGMYKEAMAKVSDSEKIANIRKHWDNLPKQVQEALDEHAGTYIHDTRVKHDIETRRSRYALHAESMDSVHREYNSRVFESGDLLTRAEQKVQGLQANVNAYNQSRARISEAGGGNSLLQEYDAAKASLAKVEQDIAENAALREELFKVPQGQRDAQAITIATKEKMELSKRKEALEAKIENDLPTKIDAALKQPTAEGEIIQLLSHNGKPIKGFKNFEAFKDGVEQQLAEAPEHAIIKDAPAMQELQKIYSEAALRAKEQADIAREIASGSKPLPPEVDPDLIHTPLEQNMTPEARSAYFSATFSDANRVLPLEQMLEIDAAINAMAPMQKTMESGQRLIANLDSWHKGMSAADKKTWGPHIEAYKKSLEKANKAGESVWQVMEDIRSGGGDEVLNGIIAAAGGNAAKDTVEVQLTDILKSGGRNKVALIEAIRKKGGHVSSDAMDSLSVINSLDDTTTDSVRAMTDTIFNLKHMDQLLDISKDAGGGGFMEGTKTRKTTLRSRYKDSKEKGAGTWKALRQTVSDAFTSMNKFADDPMGVVKASARQMLASSRAFENLGSHIQEVTDPNFTKTMTDFLTADKVDFNEANSVFGTEMKNLYESGGVEAATQYMADILFAGGDKLRAAVKEVPGIIPAVKPVLELQVALDRLKLMTPDAKHMADHFYIRDFFPRMRAFDAKFGDGAGAARAVLEKAGILGGPGSKSSGKLLIAPESIGNHIKEGLDLIGSEVDSLAFLRLDQEGRMDVLTKAAELRNPGVAPNVTDTQYNKALSAALMEGRINTPGGLLKARVASVGKAETQRKFLERLSMATGKDGKTPLIWRRGIDETESTPRVTKDADGKEISSKPEGFIDVKDISSITPREYEIKGVLVNSSDLSMSPEAAKIYKDLVGADWGEGNAAIYNATRAVNSLALQGSHLPFLYTIGGNMWQAMGFNYARLSQAFDIQNQFSGEGEWSRLMTRAAQKGLEMQSVEKNATLLTRSFKESHPELMLQMRDSALNQPGFKAAANQLKENVLGTGLFKSALDASIDLDEFAMDHLLFQNLRDMQVVAWMHKAGEIEASLTPKMIKEGYSPVDIRDLAERQASAFVNTFSGSIEKGITSTTARGIFRIGGLTPQFTMARVRQVTGAISEDTFAHLPQEMRGRLVGEYRKMLGTMTAVGLISTAGINYFLGGGWNNFEKPEGKAFQISGGGNTHFSNPLATNINTISKLTGAQELARIAYLTGADAMGMDVPADAINPGMGIGGVLSAAKQSAQQATNLMSPLLKGAGTVTGAIPSGINAETSIPKALSVAAASSSGLYQTLANVDSWTGEKRQDWERWTNAAGIYTSKNTDIKSYDTKMKAEARDVETGIQEAVSSLLRASALETKNNPKKATELFNEAYKLADPNFDFEDGGRKVSKAMKKHFAKESNLGRDGRWRLTAEQWQNCLDAVGKPKEYQMGRVGKSLRENALSAAMGRREDVLDAKRRRQNIGGFAGLGDALGEL